MVIDQEQEKEIENCLKSIRKLNSPSLAELKQRIEKEYDIKAAETVAPAATPKTDEAQKVTDTSNVSLKILEVSGEIKKALHVYKIVQEIVNSHVPGKQINIMGAKNMFENGKLVLENIPKPKADEYKKKIEEEPQAAKVEIVK